MDRNLSELLRWSIVNSAVPNGTDSQSTPTSTNDVTAVRAIEDGSAAPATNGATTNGTVPAPVRSDLTPEVLAALFGGPSEAELMKAAMEAIMDVDPSNTLENRLAAFDNFEQLIESLDNANNLEKLDLWAPLLDLLEHEERELRRMAAWCVGTAVQNNVKTQEHLHTLGGIPRLVALATHREETEAVRRKAVYALSSAVRNYQPAMDAAAEELEKRGHGLGDKVDAADMDAIDEIMNTLKEKAKAGPSI